jgi:hypothetical protein
MERQSGKATIVVDAALDADAVLLAEVTRTVDGLYQVVGEMGRSTRGSVVYLARDLAASRLVALKLYRTDGTDPPEYTLEVGATLDATIPGLECACPDCGKPTPDWGRYCYRCGADLGSGVNADQVEAMTELVTTISRTTAAEYELLGYIPRTEGGGVVFFAHWRPNGQLVALRIRRVDTPGAQPSYAISRTGVLKPIAAQAARTDIAGVRRVATEPSADGKESGAIGRATTAVSQWLRRITRSTATDQKHR